MDNIDFSNLLKYLNDMDNIDFSILLKYLDDAISHSLPNIDCTFLDSKEKTISEKEKYGLAANEKIGLVINGKIKGDSQTRYTTVLSSERFLLFCNSNKIYDIKWSNMRSVSHSGKSIVFKLKDGAEKTIYGGFLEEGIDKTNNTIYNNIDVFILLIKDKIS